MSIKTTLATGLLTVSMSAAVHADDQSQSAEKFLDCVDAKLETVENITETFGYKSHDGTQSEALYGTPGQSKQIISIFYDQNNPEKNKQVTFDRSEEGQEKAEIVQRIAEECGLTLR